MLVHLNEVSKSSWTLTSIYIFKEDTNNLIFFAVANELSCLYNSSNNFSAKVLVWVLTLDLEEITFVYVAIENLNSDVFSIEGRELCFDGDNIFLIADG